MRRGRKMMRVIMSERERGVCVGMGRIWELMGKKKYKMEADLGWKFAPATNQMLVKYESGWKILDTK